MGEQLYEILTWDTNHQAYSRQHGVDSPVTRRGLKKALQQLRDLGYEGRKPDAAVRVIREDEIAAGEWWPPNVLRLTGPDDDDDTDL